MKLAIIPARSGSKRIKNKNILDFFGKPLIYYALKAAKESKLFDEIHVSTDSNEIKKIVEKLGFKVDFLRDKKLADDYTGLVPVLKWVNEEYKKMGKIFEDIFCIMPAAPLLKPVDLSKAYKKYKNFNSEHPLLVVSSYPVPVEWAFTLSQNGKLTPMQPGMFAKRSQDLVEKYFDIGSFSIFPSKKILESKGAGNDHEFVGKVFPNYKSIDIDTPDDWLYAEALYRGLFIYKNTE